MKLPPSQIQTEPWVTEQEWTVDGLPVLTASITLPRPVPVSGRAALRISRFYRLQARSFLRYCERWLLPYAKAAHQSALTSSSPLSCFRATLDYQVTYNENGLWSLYTRSREVLPSGQFFLMQHGDTWDLRSGYPASLASFFPPRSHWRKQLLSFVEEEILQQETSGISAYAPHWKYSLRRHFNAKNFYLTENGLAIFFPMNSIAPSAERIPTFLIPYEKLSDFSPHNGK